MGSIRCWMNVCSYYHGRGKYTSHSVAGTGLLLVFKKTNFPRHTAYSGETKSEKKKSHSALMLPHPF